MALASLGTTPKPHGVLHCLAGLQERVSLGLGLGSAGSTMRAYDRCVGGSRGSKERPWVSPLAPVTPEGSEWSSPSGETGGSVMYAAFANADAEFIKVAVRDGNLVAAAETIRRGDHLTSVGWSLVRAGMIPAPDPKGSVIFAVRKDGKYNTVAVVTATDKVARGKAAARYLASIAYTK